MSRMRILRSLAALALFTSTPIVRPLAAQEVLVCGADELFILDLGSATPEKHWSWRARDRSAHAVVWDAERQLLWADSQRDVVVPLPDINGHDMMPVPGSSQLILATAAHTWLFDRTTHQFTKHPRLGDVPRVKSVHIDTVT